METIKKNVSIVLEFYVPKYAFFKKAFFSIRTFKFSSRISFQTNNLTSL